MTPEKLELHKRLQKLYKDKIGHDIRLLRTVPSVKVDGISVYCPLPIDPVNPERGLWGMVCWKKWLQESTEVDGEILIFQRMSNGGKQFTGDPETALLKALITQEG
jgi:hypothetical protein